MRTYSVVSSRYEKALPQAIKHVVTGDIVRMLLIQVQFIKKELLVAVRFLYLNSLECGCNCRRPSALVWLCDGGGKWDDRCA